MLNEKRWRARARAMAMATRAQNAAPVRARVRTEEANARQENKKVVATNGSEQTEDDAF